MKILLVEDEEDLAGLIAKGLGRSHYAVDWARDGEEAVDYLRVASVDLVILDLNLPGIDGLSLLRRIREKDRTVKVLILSARDRIDDRILGLDRGANDYLTKPFDFRELEARIRVLIRTRTTLEDDVVEIGALEVNVRTHEVKVRGIRVPLTPKEYSVLEYLAHHPGQPVDTKQLLAHVWTSGSELFPTSIKYHIHSLRAKLLEADGRWHYVANARGYGYQLTTGEAPA